MASHRIEIINELRALEQFCTFKTVRSADDHNRFLTDYLADIQEFPLEAIQKACAKWRTGGSTKFPTPGQLIPLIRESLPFQGGERAQEWRPLEDAEYDALSLRDKIRHQQILAAEARRKAGPMWRAKPGNSASRPVAGHVEAEEMPATWRKWNDIASHHEAEAKRLRGYLNRAPLARTA